MQVDSFWSRRLLSDGSEKCGGAKAERCQGHRGSNPIQGGAVECELRAEFRHALAVMS